MHIFQKNFFKGMNKPDFQNNLWTLLASGVVSVFNFAIKLIVVRLFGLTDAGVFSFAIAVASLSCVLVLFGVRAFQSTDIRQEYSLSSYVGLRVCTTLLAIIALIAFLIVSRFYAHRTIVIILVCFVYWVDAFADVFMGDLQQKEKMRIAGRMRVCAFISNAVIFSIVALTSRSLVFSLLSAGVATSASYIIWIWFYRNQFRRVRKRFNIANIKKLAVCTMPFTISGIFGTFLLMAQTYYLSFLHTDESVAVFTILVMPLSSLAILGNAFFLGAEMTKTAIMYESGDIKKMTNRINRQILFATALSFVFLLCMYSFGIPLLSWLYDIDLSLYARDFKLLAVSCILILIFYILGAPVTVFRKQKAWMRISIGITVLTAPINWVFVWQHKITGAVLATLVTYSLLTVTAYILYRVSLREHMIGFNSK